MSNIAKQCWLSSAINNTLSVLIFCLRIGASSAAHWHSALRARFSNTVTPAAPRRLAALRPLPVQRLFEASPGPSSRRIMSSGSFWSDACKNAAGKPLQTLLDALYGSCGATVRRARTADCALLAAV